MASLLHRPCCNSELHQLRFMDMPEPCSVNHHQLLRRNTSLSSSWLTGQESFLSLSLFPYIWRHIPLAKVFRLTPCTGHHNSFRRSPIVSAKKGESSQSTIALGGECKVVWTIKADLEEDKLLYVTGDPIVLGCWEPDMAVQMSPTEHADLWKAEIKIASGVNFKYNYFIKGETWLSSDIIWRPGPEFCLSVPAAVKQDKIIMVRDSWMRFGTRRSSTHMWESLIEETYLPLQPLISAPAKDEDKIEKCLESDLTESDLLVHDLMFNEKLYYDNEDSISATQKNPYSHGGLTETDQPIEEPWLLQSPLLLHISNDNTRPETSIVNDTVKDEVGQLSIHDQRSKGTGNLLNDSVKDEVGQLSIHDQGSEGARNLLSGEAGKLTLDTVSTVILINSSICTMQRIAVLEDGKLVELLLEPVKSNVQCDSVYVGVVTKLVPHMGGAFVNIGNSRPSLMDIKQNREPFIFPPFRQTTKKKLVNDSVFETIEEHIAPQANESLSDDVETTDDVMEVEFQDGRVHSTHNDYEEENEVEDDFDVSEVLRENVNGSIVDSDFKDYLTGKEHYLECETRNGSIAVPINGSDISQMSHLHDRKDSKQSVTSENKWAQVRKGTKIIVQVVKEGLGTKGPTLTAYPKLRSRFWVLITRCNRIGVSKKISGVERTRLRVIAKTLQPQDFGLTVRTVAAGHSLEELQKDLEGLISTWKNIMEHAKSAALAADEGVEGAVPVILHRAMGQTLSVVQDYFNEKVNRMVVDSPRTYYEITNYLQEIAPDLCGRVELYDKRIPLFDEFNIEEEINHILSKRVPLANGGSLVIEQTEALVSVDVNGGHGMFGHGTSPEKAILEVNLAAARQIARELRLRDIGGIIVVDFIDMEDESNKRLVYEEVKKAVERDRSMVKVSELSRHGLMEITRKRVRPSVTFMISEPCPCCHATGRVEALETSFSKIEQEISRLLATMDQKADSENPKSWPKFILRVDHHMCDYLTSGKRTRLAILSSSLKVWILLKVARGFTRGSFEVKLFTDDKVNRSQHQVAISILQRAEGRSNNSGKKVTLFPVKKWKASGR